MLINLEMASCFRQTCRALRARPSPHRVSACRRSNSAQAGSAIALKPHEKQLLDDYSLRVETLESRGRGLIYRGARVVPAGTVLLDEVPLVAIADASSDISCTNCFLTLPSHAIVACECGAKYCSASCKEAAWNSGHDALCGGTAELDQYCRQQGVNFPRTAAAMLARSLSADTDFVQYWERVNRLSHASTGLPSHAGEDEYPVGWRDGYRLVVQAVSPRMGGDKEAFFGRVFNLRFYARLMGTLRLNTFSFLCPLDAPPDAAGNAGAGEAASAGAGAGAGSAAVQGQAAGQTSGASSNFTSDGCCSGDTSCTPSSPSSTSCGGLAKAGEAPGGTVLYALASMANHACDPSLDVQVGPRAVLNLRTRRPVHPGEELTVTYLDSSLPVELRQAKLKLYGFTCTCTLCTAQWQEQKEQRAAERKAAAGAAR